MTQSPGSCVVAETGDYFCIMSNEIWADVPGYNGTYQVSTMGRVRGRKILKPDHTKDGYLLAQLCKDGKRQKVRINRLVAIAFIPNPDGLPQVNHKNEIKTDNRAENLEWVTAKENINAGSCIMRRAAKQGKRVICNDTGEIFVSIGAASRKTGVSASAISYCCKGIRETVLGRSFAFAD